MNQIQEHCFNTPTPSVEAQTQPIGSALTLSALIPQVHSLSRLTDPSSSFTFDPFLISSITEMLL
jgi:hypothetical protein